MLPLVLKLALAAALLWPVTIFSAELSKTVVLVAKRHLQDKIYGATILLARPIGGERHVGVIVNKPTRTTLSALFPNHPPSKKVVDPVFLGGPMGAEVIFALVQRKDSPGNRSLKIAPDLFLATDSKVVDRIIETQPSHARFFAGIVVWTPGELSEEIRRGYWFTAEPSVDVVLRKPTDGLWEELVNRLEKKANTI